MFVQSWYSIIPKNRWVSIYVWVIFCLLPFFFIFKASTFVEISIGIILLALFFLSYYFSFKSKSGIVYMWLSFQMLINIIMTILFGFVYFSIFTANFIGNIRSTVGFFIIYGIHIATTLGAIIAGFFLNIELILPQIHFILICLIGTVLLPFNLFNRHRQENLEGQLEVAREKISELNIIAERQRIARDLHDTLGQKLSLIGLKSDLAIKLIKNNPEQAESELQDIRKTSSTALNEVRDLVANIRSTKLANELNRGKQILQVANINLTVSGDIPFPDISPISENILG